MSLHGVSRDSLSAFGCQGLPEHYFEGSLSSRGWPGARDSARHYFAIASGSGLRAVRGPAPTCPLSIDARLVDPTARRDAAPARQEVLAWQDHALRADSHEELVAVGVGYRESTESWSELLRDLERRGMLAPVLRIQVA